MFRQTKKFRTCNNKLRFFIQASNIHDQISLILLNDFTSTIYVTIFPAECLIMKLLIDIRDFKIKAHPF